MERCPKTVCLQALPPLVHLEAFQMYCLANNTVSSDKNDWMTQAAACKCQLLDSRQKLEHLEATSCIIPWSPAAPRQPGTVLHPLYRRSAAAVQAASGKSLHRGVGGVAGQH
jgi:hypothetical protein